MLSDLDLNEVLISPLEAGARLHCFIDAAPFGLSVGLPYVAFLRQDCWPAWEVTPPAPEPRCLLLLKDNSDLCEELTVCD